MGPRAGLDGKSCLHRDSIPDRPARIQSLYQLSYPAHLYYVKILNIIHVFMCNKILHMLSLNLHQRKKERKKERNK